MFRIGITKFLFPAALLPACVFPSPGCLGMGKGTFAKAVRGLGETRHDRTRREKIVVSGTDGSVRRHLLWFPGLDFPGNHNKNHSPWASSARPFSYALANSKTLPEFRGFLLWLCGSPALGLTAGSKTSKPRRADSAWSFRLVKSRCMPKL